MTSLQDSPEEQVKVLEYVQSKGFRSCPVCAQALLEEGGAIGFGVGRKMGMIYHKEDPDEYAVFVPVICANCGYALWFNASQLPGQAE